VYDPCYEVSAVLLLILRNADHLCLTESSEEMARSKKKLLKIKVDIHLRNLENFDRYFISYGVQRMERIEPITNNLRDISNKGHGRGGSSITQ
jgi:hypothetical protein